MRRGDNSVEVLDFVFICLLPDVIARNDSDEAIQSIESEAANRIIHWIATVVTTPSQ